jgi:hypothetical protein
MTNSPECNTADYLDQLLARNEREHAAFKRLNPLEQAKWQGQMYLHYASNPWAFLRDNVYTLNQIAKDDFAVQPFPSYLEYLKFLCELWQTEDRLAVPKSRRMVCSWSFISLYTHDTLFKEGRFNAFVSKKEEDAGELVSRAEFIYHKIPEWRLPKELLPKIKNGRMTKDPYVLEFEGTHSLIRGFPQGAHQMRQFTISGILGDECAFWAEAQAFYSASKPTLDGGGRMTLISSRSPGFFKKIVYDQMDAKDLNFKETPPAAVKKPMEGVDVWRNPKNKFVVVDLRYNADPRKRSTKWRDETKASMPLRDFLMEYEGSWQTYDESPVFNDFNRDIHTKKSAEFHVEPHIPLLLGFSFGMTPSCLIAQLVGRTLKIHREFQVSGSVKELAFKVSNCLSFDFAQWLHFEGRLLAWAHPDGFERKETNEKSSVEVLRADVVRGIRSGESIWETGKLAVEEFMTRTYGDGPGLQISDECPILIDALSGGYRWPASNDKDEEPSSKEPVKDKSSRMAECLLFICAATSQKKKMQAVTMTVPLYSFMDKS